MSDHIIPASFPIARLIEIVQTLLDANGFTDASEVIRLLAERKVSDEVLTRARMSWAELLHRVGSEPPCSCALLRAKGHGAECSRCPPVMSSTRAAAEVHCEVLSRASAESAIYERGGYVSAPTLGPHGHYAGCPGPGGKPCICAEKDMLPAKPHVLRRCAHIPPEYVGLCALCRPSAPHPPGLMLGEASIDWAAVAQAIVERGPAILLRRGLIPAGSVDEARRALLYAFDAAIGVSGAEARSLVTANVRETEARESRPSCWQCEAPLGTTTGCLTCDAKKREDAQRTPTET